MKRIKNIPHPVLDSANRLTPLQMNSIRLQKQHSVLTRKQLDSIASDNK